MPYIKPEQRGQLKHRTAQNAGELNYVITRICLGFIENKADVYAQVKTIIEAYIIVRGLSYQTLNDCMGVLCCCTAELYRRLGDNDMTDHLTSVLTSIGTDLYASIIAPYEDKAIERNGDLF